MSIISVETQDYITEVLTQTMMAYRVHGLQNITLHLKFGVLRAYIFSLENWEFTC